MTRDDLLNLIELARIGLRKVVDDSDKNIISWLGQLPKPSDLRDWESWIADRVVE